MVNPGWFARYFQDFEPALAYNPFLKDKPEQVFRVFALGGSTTAGFPYFFYHGFPARLAEKLEAAHPTRRIEVVNLGATAVSSWTLSDLTGAVIEHEPDAVVIYAGHNEYYGAFGAGSTVGRLRSPGLKRLVLRLKRTVLYTLLERLISRQGPSADRTLMARVARDRAISLGGTTYRAGLEQFEGNMRAVLKDFARAGIMTFVGTLTSNLQDQPPLGEDVESLQAYARGVELLRAADPIDARQAFLEAKERDDVRFRAPEAMNEIIRRLADELDATLVDVQGAFRSQGLEGDSLFTDHLHPNAKGYDVMAAAFFDGLSELGVADDMVAHLPEVFVDPVDEAYAALQIRRLKGGYPFAKAVSPDEEARAFAAMLEDHLGSGRLADSLAAELAMGVTTPPEALLGAARYAREAADTLAALLYYRSLMHWQPFNDELFREAVAFGSAAVDFDSALGSMVALTVRQERHVDRLNLLAAIQLRQGRLRAADLLLSEVEQRDSLSTVMLFNKARLLVLTGDTLAARSYWDRYRAASK